MNIEITPIRAYVATKFFYNGEQVEKELTTLCDIFAISSYKGSQPSFNVRIRKNGGLFHDLPVQAITAKEKTEPLTYKLCYSNAPCFDICINEFEFLKGPVKVFIGDNTFDGQYKLTIDWFRCNENTHLIELEHGQFCLFPSHKVLFRSTEATLPPYRKLR